MPEVKYHINAEKLFGTVSPHTKMTSTAKKKKTTNHVDSESIMTLGITFLLVCLGRY